MDTSSSPEPTKEKSNTEDKLTNVSNGLNSLNEKHQMIAKVILIACICLAVIYLLYYAWSAFNENSQDESFVENNRSVRSDTEVDFNLEDRIKELERMQNTILQQISNMDD